MSVNKLCQTKRRTYKLEGKFKYRIHVEIKKKTKWKKTFAKMSLYSQKSKKLSMKRVLKMEDTTIWRKSYDGDDIFFLSLKFLHLAPSHLDRKYSSSFSGTQKVLVSDSSLL